MATQGDVALEDDSEIEEGDIQALARAQLGDGEYISGEGPRRLEDARQGICNKEALLQKLKDIQYKVPEGAKRVPWVDTLMIEGFQDIPKEVGVKDGVKLESTFMRMACDAVREAYRRLQVMKIPCTRPSDFYAEMLRTDKQMYRVRATAAEEQRRMKIVEDRKKSAASKKFAKKAKATKLKARAQEKEQNLKDIKDWKDTSKKRKNVDEKDLNDILDRQKRGGDKGSGKKKLPEKSVKRQAADAKYGFGGKKKRSRQNDAASLDDFSSSPWGKGKGSKGGKGKGGKGKGKGKGKSGGKKGKR